MSRDKEKIKNLYLSKLKELKKHNLKKSTKLRFKINIILITVLLKIDLIIYINF